MTAVQRTTPQEFSAEQLAAAFALALPLDDLQTRLFLLTRLVAEIDSGEAVSSLVHAGLDQESIDRLRGMSMADALRFASNPCGLSLSVNTREVRGQLCRIESAKLARSRLEYFVSNGASPRLLTQLFSIAPSEVRRMRKLLAPAITAGGRPRVPSPEESAAIEVVWQEIRAAHADDRERIWHLHQSFQHMWIATLELVIMPPTTPSLTLLHA